MIDVHPYLMLDTSVIETDPRHARIADSPQARRLALLVYEAVLAGAEPATVADLLERWACVLDDVSSDKAMGKADLARGAMLLRRVLDAPLGLPLTVEDHQHLHDEAMALVNHDDALASPLGGVGVTLAQRAALLLMPPAIGPSRAQAAALAWADASELLWTIWLHGSAGEPCHAPHPAAEAAIAQCAHIVHERLLRSEGGDENAS